MPEPRSIFCEIRAPGQAAADLAHIAEFCAKEIGLALEVTARDERVAEPLVTLHSTAEQAASQHPIWCLVCRLACFCPQARVGVLVHAQDRFVQPAASRARGCRTA
jgi:hypothetical protein